MVHARGMDSVKRGEKGIKVKKGKRIQKDEE